MSIPHRSLFDTGVLVRALGDREDKDTPACKRLYEELRAASKVVVVAAPTVSEMLRGVPSRELPHSDIFEIQAFTRKSAEYLGKALPETVLMAHWTSDPDYREHYIKYDAMIVACAFTAKVDCVFSLDKGVRRLCAEVGIRVFKPGEYTEVDGRVSDLQPPLPLG